MHFLDTSFPQSLPDNQVVRSIEAGPDYKPDWRLRVAERYLLAISGAKTSSAAVDLVLNQEHDPYIRQLVRFHAGRRCVIGNSLEYALRCLRCDFTTRIPALIKAMVVAARSCEQIAEQVGTKPINIRTYEKLAFDVRRYGGNRIWLRNICFPTLPLDASPQQRCEARFLAIAYEGGWPRLQNLLLTQQSPRSVNTRADLDQFTAILAARALDFVIGLEAQGFPPSERDVELLFLAQHRMPVIALPPFSPSERTTDPIKTQAQEEQQAALKKVPLRVRRRIIAILERIQNEAAMKIEPLIAQEEPRPSNDENSD